MTEIADIHHYPPSDADERLTVCWREDKRHREISKFGVEAATIMDRVGKCPDSKTLGLVLRGVIEEWRIENG